MTVFKRESILASLDFMSGKQALGKGWAGDWDGNVGCDDDCTTMNVIKFIEFKKNQEFPLWRCRNESE